MNGGLHSRRLSATADVNYADLLQEPVASSSSSSNRSKNITDATGSQSAEGGSQLDLNKPLPPIRDPADRSLATSISRKPRTPSGNVRFNLQPKAMKGQNRDGYDGDDNFEDFDIDGEDYESEDKVPKEAATAAAGSSSRGYIYWILHPSYDMLVILFCIIGWYTFSLAISLYNKWMFDKSTLNFPFPIISTSFHQLVLFCLSFALIYFVPSWRPPTAKQVQLGVSIENSNGGTTTESEELEEGSLARRYFFHFTDYMMDKKLYIVSILPCALATSGDIGTGNVSFRFITLSLYTMIKSSSIAFVLIFGVLFKLEKLTWKLSSIVVIMTFGVMMMVGGSKGSDTKVDTTSADSLRQHSDLLFGSFLVLLSSCMSGLRWALTQLVLKKNKHINSPIATIFYLSPPIFLVMLVFGAFIEKFSNFFQNEIWTEQGVPRTLGILVIPGLLVFCMTLFELKLLQKSHVVTLSIAGIFKELLTIVASTFIFGDNITFVNCIGLVITLLDILWYNYYRFSEQKQEVAYQPMTDDEDIELRRVRNV